jgi:hypothetical protein
VVRAGEHRHATRRQPLEVPDVPERARPVEPATHELAHDCTKLVAATRRGDWRDVEVLVEVEARVVDPDRVVEPERDLMEAAEERRDAGQTPRE